MAREHYVGTDEESEKRRKAYLELMVSTSVHFGAKREDAEECMAEVMDFERKLAELSDPREAR